ncbi:unnamed protein product [Rhizopus stolonifer]
MYKQSSLNSSASHCPYNRYQEETKICSLTMENVSKLDMVKSCETPLARYCSEIDSPIASNSSASSLKKRPQRQDRVLESPRIVPFPYHNDSSFLPTAEQDYPGNGMITDTTSNASVYTNDSRSTLRNAPSHTYAHQRPSIDGFNIRDHTLPRRTTHNFNFSKRRRSTSFSTLYTHFEEKMNLEKNSKSKKQLKLRQRKDIFRFKSANHSRDSLTKNSSSTAFSNKDSSKWYKRLWNFLISATNQKTRPGEATTRPTSYSPTQPVWYIQYKYNPSSSSRLTVVS